MTHRFFRLLFAAILSLAAAGQWQCKNDREDGALESTDYAAALAVKASPIMREEWISTIPISGNLQTLYMVEVMPEVGGRLVAVHFQEGDQVRKNQLLAEIDPVNYRLAYDQAAAALAVAEAGLERARIAAAHAAAEKNRADNLLKSGGITQKDHLAAAMGVKEAEAQVLLAEAQRDQARAALAIAEKALEDCRILAPEAGYVQKRFFDEGALLSPGVPLCTLVDNRRLELECVIPSYRLSEVRIGQQATFTTPTWGDRVFKGTVSAINPVVESDNRSVTLKLKISNPGGELRSGMYAQGEILTGREDDAVIIPRDSLVPEEEGQQVARVYIVREGTVHRVDVEIGGTQQDRVWIRKGLQEGDLLITEIGPSLREGSAVRVLQQ